MILRRLRLVNWRGYSVLDLDFEKGLNLILGPNGAGKTNLAEAIGYLSLARSFRVSDNQLLILAGSSQASVIAELQEEAIHRSVEIFLSKKDKRIAINGKPCRKISELSRSVNVLTFIPEDVSLFLDSPGRRRSFLDVSLSKGSQDYFSLISAYSKVLHERNLALKEPEIDRSLIEVYTDQMKSLEPPIIAHRRRYVNLLNSVLPHLLASLRGEQTSCALVYAPFVKDGEGLEERIEKAHQQALEGELLKRTTNVGVHREDFRFLFNGKDVGSYGSQGENRLSSLCLKLAPYFLVEEESEKPIVVLDDVMSELDQTRQKNLLLLLKDFSQVFLTATNLEAESASVIDVASHIATRRK